MSAGRNPFGIGFCLAAMNRWGIPRDLEEQIKARDAACVYCHSKFGTEGGTKATWEHFDNDRWDDVAIMATNVALCCNACNASKGAKKLQSWLASRYCVERNIRRETVAQVVQDFLSSASLSV